MRALLFVAVAVMWTPSLALAQGPPPPPGKLDPKDVQLPSSFSTAKVLPIEVVSATPDQRGVKYQRAGLKPTGYRIGSTPQMTDAVWKQFSEGATTTSVINGRTVHGGLIPDSGPSAGPTGGCPSGHFRVRGFLQFRAVTAGVQTVVSNIKGDSACISMGG